MNLVEFNAFFTSRGREAHGDKHESEGDKTVPAVHGHHPLLNFAKRTLFY
jgi:hypothetical protein